MGTAQALVAVADSSRFNQHVISAEAMLRSQRSVLLSATTRAQTSETTSKRA